MGIRKKIKDFVNTKVAEKLKNTNPEDIITPKANVAGPLLESLKYTGHNDSLQDLYANLLASAMDKKTAEGALPCFVEIIKQMTSDEAKIMQILKNTQNFPIINIQSHYREKSLGNGYNVIEMNYSHLGKIAKCEYPNLTPKYIDNLCRLGLTEIPFDTTIADKNVYDILDNDTYIINIIKNIEISSNRIGKIEHRLLTVTELGKLFIDVCVVSKEHTINFTFGSASTY